MNTPQLNIQELETLKSSIDTMNRANHVEILKILDTQKFYALMNLYFLCQLISHDVEYHLNVNHICQSKFPQICLHYIPIVL